MALNTYTPNTIIQSSQINADLTGLSNGSNDATNNSMATYRTESNFDFVASGCVWSGDSYAVNRNASQTSGVVYIAGVRLAVSAVSGRTFTASKDTYIDVNGSGVQVYTEVTNNAASPALAAGSIRAGIIITGATTIAAATSVNQGQETMVLPIASSIAYSVTDSLGNLICGRDINRKVLGYRQVTGILTGISTTAAQLTGLTCPVIVPTGRKVKISLYGIDAQNNNVNQTSLGIWDGTPNVGTRLAETDISVGANLKVPASVFAVTTPTAASKTYNGSLHVSANTGTFEAAPTAPGFILVELA